MDRRSFLGNIFTIGIMATLPIPMLEQMAKAEETKKTLKGKLYAPLRLDNGFWLFDMDDRLLCLGELDCIDVKRSELGISREWVTGPDEIIYGREIVYFQTSGKSLYQIVAEDFLLDKQYKAVYIKDEIQVFSNVYLESFQGLAKDSVWQFYKMTFVSSGAVEVVILK